MKILATSDTHGLLDGLDKAIDKNEPDVVVFAGDIAPATIGVLPIDYVKNTFFPFVERHPSSEFILVPGNHDIWAQTYNGEFPSELKDILPHNFTFLVDAGVEIKGQLFWGTPWVPFICGHWAYESHDELDESDIAKRFELIPSDTDVLITHTPPRIKDCELDISLQTKRGPFGSTSLGRMYAECKIHPKLHFCGHIHSGDHAPFDVVNIKKETSSNDHFSCELRHTSTTSVCNVSRVDERYQIAYDPTVVEISDDGSVKFLA